MPPVNKPLTKKEVIGWTDEGLEWWYKDSLKVKKQAKKKLEEIKAEIALLRRYINRIKNRRRRKRRKRRAG